MVEVAFARLARAKFRRSIEGGAICHVVCISWGKCRALGSANEFFALTARWGTACRNWGGVPSCATKRKTTEVQYRWLITNGSHVVRFLLCA